MDKKELSDQIYTIEEEYESDIRAKRSMAGLISQDKNKKYLDELIALSAISKWLNCLREDKVALSRILKEKIEVVGCNEYPDPADKDSISGDGLQLRINHENGTAYLESTIDWDPDYEYEPPHGISSKKERRKRYTRLR